MAVALSRISYWLMRSDPNKKKSRRCPKSSPKSSPLPDFPSESVNFNFATQPSSSRRIRKNRKEKKGVDKEYDLVIVPSDGECLSGSESDGSDWSIGWLEPHACEFYNSDAESEDSFAVLVPCYGLNLERNKIMMIIVRVLDLGLETRSEMDSLNAGILLHNWFHLFHLSFCKYML